MTKKELALLNCLLNKAETQARKLLEIRHSIYPIEDYKDLNNQPNICDDYIEFSGTDRYGSDTSFSIELKWLADEEGFIEKTKKSAEEYLARKEQARLKQLELLEQKERKEFMRLQEKFGK